MILFCSALSDFLLADCFVSPNIFIVFCKTRVRAHNSILVIPYINVVRIEDAAFIIHVGCINDNMCKNLILGCLEYIIMFVKMQ